MTPRLGIFLAVLAMAPPLARGQTEAQALSASFRNAARPVLPAVVTIRGLGGLRPIAPLPGFVDPSNPFPGRDGVPDAGGSGVIVDSARGYIVTNDHVVPDAPRLVVTLADGRERTVREVRRDPRSDIALLIIDPKNLPAQAQWGDSEALDLADWVLAIGQPFGLSGTVTAGIVSGGRRGFSPVGYDDLLQTSAAINPGSSGGPLIDLQGKVVGINVAIKTLSGGYEGVGFAVPSARARRVVSDLAEFGQVRRSVLGISTEPTDPERVADGQSPPGVRVTSVVKGSPAEVAGLRLGDVILKVGDRPTLSPAAIRSAVEFAPAGRDLALTIFRDGQEMELACKPEPPGAPAQIEPRPLGP